MIVSAPPLAQAGAMAMLSVSQTASVDPAASPSPSISVYISAPVPSQAGVYLTLSPGATLSFALFRSLGALTQPIMNGDQGMAQIDKVFSIGSADSVSVRLNSYTSGILVLLRQKLTMTYFSAGPGSMGIGGGF